MNPVVHFWDNVYEAIRDNTAPSRWSKKPARTSFGQEPPPPLLATEGVDPLSRFIAQIFNGLNEKLHHPPTRMIYAIATTLGFIALMAAGGIIPIP